MDGGVSSTLLRLGTGETPKGLGDEMGEMVGSLEMGKERMEGLTDGADFH